MRDRFRLLVHESEGQKYEDLFIKIMGYANPEFRPIKPHGNAGDRGNDGYVHEEGIYYQVYAPEDLPKNTTTAISKMKEDFQKLLAYWDPISPIKEYYFVVNDKYKGGTHHIINALENLKEEHKLEYVGIFPASKLEEIFFQLPQDKQDAILSIREKEVEKLKIYKHLTEEITNKMCLQRWDHTSENLISNAILDEVLQGFCDASLLIARTSLPNISLSFEGALLGLGQRVDDLVEHFTESDQAILTDDHLFWMQDNRWRRHSQSQIKYSESEEWRQALYKRHFNLVHALNIFFKEVRSLLYPDYFLGVNCAVVDTLGTYNNGQGVYIIPSEFMKD